MSLVPSKRFAKTVVQVAQLFFEEKAKVKIGIPSEIANDFLYFDIF
jgi:hypothetical protein